MARTVLPSVLFAFLTLPPAMLAQQGVDALGDPLPEGAISRVGVGGHEIDTSRQAGFE